MSKWTSEAGPRQTKQVDKAIRDLSWQTKKVKQINDWGVNEVVAALICGSDDQKARFDAAIDPIGERFGWTITRKNYREIIEAVESATKAVDIPVEDCRTTPEERERRAEVQQKAQKERAEQEAAVKASAEALRGKIPASAKSLIVAELDENDSDLMTDYHNHKTARRVVIGWRTSTRENFAKLREAAGRFPETAHLGPGRDIWKVWVLDDEGFRRYVNQDGEPSTWDAVKFETESEALVFIESTRLEGAKTDCESVEHRENWSMGSGNYLKAGGDDSSGWRVRSVAVSQLDSYAFEDGLPEASESGPVVSSAAYDIGQYTHTKKGTDMWIVVPSERLESDDFNRLRSSAKSAGGWYSRKWGTTPGGFAFESEESAKSWAVGAFGPPAVSDERMAAIMERADKVDERLQNKADCEEMAKRGLPNLNAVRVERLRAMAEKLESDGRAKLAPRETNTAKKLKLARNAERDGQQMLRAAVTVQAYCGAVEAGALPAELSGLKPTKSRFLEVAARRGTHVENGYHGYMVDSQEWSDNGAEAVALRVLVDSLKTSADVDKEQATASALKIRQLEDELRGVDIPGFFPTPEPVARRLVEAADLQPDHDILEPSAGIGSICEVIRESVGSANLLAVELRPSLCRVLVAKGLQVHCGDFLEESGRWDRIVMNPPFEKGQDAEHLRHAFGLLKPGGRVVALMSAGPWFRSDAKSVGFREWFDEVGGEVEDVEPGAFSGVKAFRSTGVSVKMVTIDKPAAVASPETSQRSRVEKVGRAVQCLLF